MPDVGGRPPLAVPAGRTASSPWGDAPLAVAPSHGTTPCPDADRPVAPADPRRRPSSTWPTARAAPPLAPTRRGARRYARPGGRAAINARGGALRRVCRAPPACVMGDPRAPRARRCAALAGGAARGRRSAGPPRAPRRLGRRRRRRPWARALAFFTSVAAKRRRDPKKKRKAGNRAGRKGDKK